MVKKILAICILLGLTGVAFMQVFSEKDPEIGASKGDKAYNFDLETLTGGNIKLSDYEGKKVIVNFWATWCGPCREEMPEMQRYYEEHKDDIEILAINITSSDTLRLVEEFVEEGEYTFPILLDESRTFAFYEVINMPSTFFINEEGIISARRDGPVTYSMMEEYVENMN